MSTRLITQYYQYVYANIGYSATWAELFTSPTIPARRHSHPTPRRNVIQQTQYTYNSGGTLATKLVQISPGYFATNSYGNYNSYGLVGLNDRSSRGSDDNHLRFNL